VTPNDSMKGDKGESKGPLLEAIIRQEGTARPWRGFAGGSSDEKKAHVRGGAKSQKKGARMSGMGEKTVRVVPTEGDEWLHHQSTTRRVNSEEKKGPRHSRSSGLGAQRLEGRKARPEWPVIAN